MAKQRESNSKSALRVESIAREPLLNRLWPFGLIVLLALMFHGRMITSAADQLIATLDIVYYFRWLHMFTYEEFMAGRMPLWNPYTYCGTPFAANPQATVFYPLSWLYLVVDIFQAQKFMVVIHTMLAGSFMYLFLRELGNASPRRHGDTDRLKRQTTTDGADDTDGEQTATISESHPRHLRHPRMILFPSLRARSLNAHEPMDRRAAIIGAIAYMFGNYMMANVSVGHLTMLFTATWLPLALFCYERALSRGRTIWLMWTGLVLGVQVLAGEPQNCYYSVVALTVYGLVRTHLEPAPIGKNWWKLIPARLLGWGLGLGLVAIVSAGACLIQLLPTTEFARLSDRSTNNYTFATFMSQSASGFVEFLVPWINEDSRGVGVIPWGLQVLQNWEYGAYIGMTTLALAGASFAVRRKPALWALRVLLVLGVVLMLGKFTPIYELLYRWMPGLNLFRIPVRAVVIVHLCLAAMAAIGAQHILSDGRSLWQSWKWLAPAMGAMTLVLGVLVTAVLVVGVNRINVPQPGVIEFADPVHWKAGAVLFPMVCAALALCAIGVAAMVRNADIAALVIGAALTADLYMSNPRVPLDRPGPLERDPSYLLLTGVARAADKSVKPFRVDCPPNQGKVPYLILNTALAAHVEAVNGYSPMSIGRFYRFVHFMRNHKPSNMTRHELPEIIYKIDEAFPLRILNVRYATKWDEQSQRYRPVETKPLPRAWIVERAEVIGDEQKTLERVRDLNFDPATTVILEQAPRIAMSPPSGGGLAGIAGCKRLAPGRMEIQTQSARDGYLVLSEIFYPGWKATIDGKPVELERADGLITALPLPAGTHTVMYEYDPISFKIGAAGTAFTWLAAATIGFIDFRRRRRMVLREVDAPSSRSRAAGERR